MSDDVKKSDVLAGARDLIRDGFYAKTRAEDA